MGNETELHQSVYRLLAAQIEFGAYQYGDPLPKMEEVCQWLSVSLDTVRWAYRQLREEGRIVITRRVGATVSVSYLPQEIERHIQTFFSGRKDAVLDLCRSLGPLFGRLQYTALKNAGEERLDELESLCARQDVFPVYVMSRQMQLIYGSLENDLLMRLVWHAFLFFQAPFLALPQNRSPFESDNSCLLRLTCLSRKRDWDGLRRTVEEFQTRLFAAISRFYEERITMKYSGPQTAFEWTPYRKSSQLCYSLAMELLIWIRGSRAEGDLLPTPAALAASKHVSVNTVRRSLALLNLLGATRTINGVGTQVLDMEHSAENCDFSRPVLQKRLADFRQSLQLLAITCKGCVEITFSSMDEASLRQCSEKLSGIKRTMHYESVVYTSLGFITAYAPVRAIREIYAQLGQALLWGYPLRGIHGCRGTINAHYLPYIDALSRCLDGGDMAGLAEKLEELLLFELEFASRRLETLIV